MDPALTTIVLATDGSDDAVLAARAAADLAQGTGAALHIAHVWIPFYPTAYPVVLPETYWQADEEAHRALLRSEVARIEQAGGAVAEAHLRAGDPAAEVVGLADELGASLLVVGSRGLGTVKRLVMGSVSEGIVHQASCPVLVMRGGDRAWPPARIVMGEDGSPEAERAEALAAHIGQLFGAGGLIVQAYELPRLPAIDPEVREEIGEGVLRQIQAALETRAAQLEATLGQRPEVRAAAGDAASAILNAAEAGGTPSLIAVGSRGLGMIQRMRLGSTSLKVLRAAHGPVLIAPRL